MADIHVTPNREQAGIELTTVEEEFLIEAEKEEQKRPCFDARALRQMGLTAPEVNLLQVFFMKARNVDFDVRRFTNSECLQSLVAALKHLPRTSDTGKITVESYKASDSIYTEVLHDAGKWAEGFRNEFGRGMIWSHKERREPALLAVLTKVFDWVEMFQKAHGLYQELPQWLKDGMVGDFRSDSWIGSDLYEGTKTLEQCRAEQAGGDMHEAAQGGQGNTALDSGSGATEKQARLIQPDIANREEPATEKQKALLKKLLLEKGIENPGFDVDRLTKKEASRRIDELFLYSAVAARREAAA